MMRAVPTMIVINGVTPVSPGIQEEISRAQRSQHPVWASQLKADKAWPYIGAPDIYTPTWPWPPFKGNPGLDYA